MSYDAGIHFIHFPFCEGKLAEKSFEFVELCKYLQKQQFIRDDYKELVNLLLLYLTGDNEQGSNMLNRTGALHRARWMSKMIYCLKIDLVSNKICLKVLFVLLDSSKRLKVLFSSSFSVIHYGG